jgi:hypothetical protein
VPFFGRYFGERNPNFDRTLLLKCPFVVFLSPSTEKDKNKTRKRHATCNACHEAPKNRGKICEEKRRCEQGALKKKRNESDVPTNTYFFGDFLRCSGFIFEKHFRGIPELIMHKTAKSAIKTPRMNNPAYTWIKSVNADNPVNKVKSDKIRKCRLSLFLFFRRRKLLFWHSGPRLSPLDSVFVLSCLI